MSFYHWFSSHPNNTALSGDVSKLHDIGQELRISSAWQEEGPKQTDFRRISSVPDIWSQHRLFEMLLLNTAVDPSYLEYEQIARREWRAMLAILVLAESYGVEIHSQTIRFADPVYSAHLRAAYNSRPQAADWESMIIYYVEADRVRYPIAMSSPGVHVVPTKDAWRNLRFVYPDRIPWLTDRQVHAPVEEREGRAYPLMRKQTEEETPIMLPVHALLLYSWLKNYRANANAGAQNMDLIFGYEKALADAFRLNMQSTTNLRAFLSQDAEQVGLQINGVSVPTGLRLFLDRVFYVLIDQASEQPNLLDTNRFAGGIAPRCLVSHDLGKGKTAHFFVALPVTETFWRLWEDNLALEPDYSICPTYSKNGVEINGITVTVTLGDLDLTQTYLAAQIDSQLFRNLCTAAIWPRQRIAGWGEYYFFCDEINGYRLEPSEPSAATPAKQYTKEDGADGTLLYSRLSSAPERCALRKDDQLIGYLQIRPRPEIPAGRPERVFHAAIDFGTSATTLYASIDGDAAFRIDGVHLWSLPLMNAADSEGRDTSRLEKYFFPPLHLPKDQAGFVRRRTLHAQDSFRQLEEDPQCAARYPSCMPMQTILADAGAGDQPRRVFRDSWIYFRAFVEAREPEKWPVLCSDLKWQRSDQTNGHRTCAILTQLLTMLALEARCRGCASIALTATYPLAFDENMRVSYFNTLNSMLMTVCQSTGVLLQSPQQAEAVAPHATAVAQQITCLTESEAAFRYSVQQESFNQNYFIMDIGGGSTDLYISQEGTNRPRNSVAASLAFGARKILLETLSAADFFFLRKLMRESGENLRTVIRNPDQYIQAFSARNSDSLIEDLFSIRIPRDPSNPAAALQPANLGEAFMNRCANDAENLTFREQYEQDAPGFSVIKKRIAFYLGAVVWLSAVMFDWEDDNLQISMLLAGNGSKIVRWITPDVKRTVHFIRLLFQRASKLNIPDERFVCRFSQRPKEEVAFGALQSVPNEYFVAGATNQAIFEPNLEQTAELPAYQATQYRQIEICTDPDMVSSYIKAFRVVAETSYGWRFGANEYDPAVLTLPGVDGIIGAKPKKYGYFLNALEAVGDKYLQDALSMLRDHEGRHL